MSDEEKIRPEEENHIGRHMAPTPPPAEEPVKAAGVPAAPKAPETAAPLAMADYRTQQLDLLADGVRSALDMDAVYAAMGLHNPRGGKK